MVYGWWVMGWGTFLLKLILFYFICFSSIFRFTWWAKLIVDFICLSFGLWQMQKEAFVIRHLSLRWVALSYNLNICAMFSLLALFVERDCINFSVSRVNFLTTWRSHLNVSCYFWSNLFDVDVNYSYILIVYCSGYLKCIENDLVNYTYFDSCWLNFWVTNQ